VRFHLDTGSSDLWVNTRNSRLCRSREDPCSISGTYQANDSSTYNYVGSYFNISYVDGSGASGDYVTDTFRIGDGAVTDFQFGVGYVSSSVQGILGVGYTINEVQVGRARMEPYDNLPAKLTKEGLIPSNAFSLYLNDLDSNTGSILFGGIDTEQYEGDLHTLPIQSEAGAYAEFLITLTSVELNGRAVQSDMALAVLLDSGSSLTYLPNDMVNQIYDLVGASFQPDEEIAFVDCALRNDPATMRFAFSEPAVIEVPLDELVIDLVGITGRPMSFSDGTPACLFGIAPAGDGTNVLGDTFLRSAYVVYDLENNEISLAQTSFNATTSNVLEITGGGVPGAKMVTNPVRATQGIFQGGQENAASPAVKGAAGTMLAAGVAFLTAVATLWL
jgi:hypothetical protein